MNRAFGRDTRYVSTIGLSQIAGGQFLHVFQPRHWINAGQAGPAGLDAAGRARRLRRPTRTRTVVALSGDYDFQFMIEELAVGAQFHLPYIHVVVNNSYLGLIRQSPARVRHGLLRAAVVRQRQQPRSSAATASTTSRWPRAWAARRCGSTGPRTSRRRSSRRKKLMAEFRVPVRRRGHPGAGHEHLDGHRAGQRRRVRGARRRWTSTRRPPSPCSTEPMRAIAAVHVVVAPDKFKGSLTAREVADAGRGRDRRRRRRASRSCRSRSPTAATARVDAAVAAGLRAGRRCARTGPTGEPVDTAFAVRDGVAVVEMADVSGLRLLPPDRLAPLHRELVRHRRGGRAPRWTTAAATVVLGIGGSASTDGGAGMLQALGARLLDAAGRRAAARRRARWPTSTGVDLSGLHPALAEHPDRRGQRRRQPAARPARRRRGVRAAEGRDPGRRRRCSTPRWRAGPTSVDARPRGRADVRRPRRAPGPRAGSASRRWPCSAPSSSRASSWCSTSSASPTTCPGAGLVVTGEGSLDEQTLHGKAPAGVAAAAAAAGIPVVTVSGRLAPDRRRSCAAPASPRLRPHRHRARRAALPGRGRPAAASELATHPRPRTGSEEDTHDHHGAALRQRRTACAAATCTTASRASPFLGEARTAPRYRFFSVRDEFPGAVAGGRGRRERRRASCTTCRWT